MAVNPFTVSFGKEPQNFISRPEEENMIIESFTAEHPSQQVFMITGVRGAGKTALLTRIKKRLSEDNRWIMVELSAEGDLLNDLIAKLCDNPILRTQFMKASINLSLFGVTLDVEEKPVNSVETALERMLKVINRMDKRLLITIDEVTSSKQVRLFTSTFQILMREEYPVYLIMTGLFKNIYDLQNVKTLTFLYRAPKIVLGGLNRTAVINSYKDTFHIPVSDAVKMADQVRGYAFAYQLFGALCFEAGVDHQDKMEEKYKELLGELVYDKLWSELSMKDREIMTIIAEHGEISVKVGDVITGYNQTYAGHTPLTSKLMSVYRERLKREGLIETPQFGYVRMALPYFAGYINEYGVI